MSNANLQQVLSRLTIAPVGSYVVYDAGHGWCFTAHMDEVHEAHVADIEPGAHPFAAITLAETIEDNHQCVDYPLLAEHLPADRDGVAMVDVLSDWIDWCDEVMSEASLGWDSDSVPTKTELLVAMRVAGHVDAGPVRIAEVNLLA